MYIVKLLRFLRGYVKFIVRSGPVERLINLCAHHGIASWNCFRTQDTFTGCTTVPGYRRMHRLARKAGVSIRVTERHGLPFITHRYRKRIGIAAGILLFAVLLAVSQQFIWVIKVEGCKELTPQVLVNALEELGVTQGTLKRSINTREIQKELPLRVNELSWAALNIRGTTATLVILERTPPPPMIDTKVPANVVAAQDGQIVKLEVTDGKSLVKKGDVVRAGDLIVSGVMEDRWGMTHLLRAKARVYAQVPQTLTVQVPLRQERQVPTGKIVNRRYLKVLGTQLPLFIYTGLEGDYTVERVVAPPELLGITMPFEVVEEQYVFFTREQEEISPDMALRMAESQLTHTEQVMWGEGILSAQRQAAVENGVLILKGTYLVEMDIAKQVEIPVNDRKEEQKPKTPREGGY